VDCKAVQQVIYKFIYGEGSADELRRIKAHLDRCKNCAAEASIIEDILVKLKDGLPEEPVPLDFRDRVLTRIHALARQE
jgi:anti-sigma factor (TIGR02949 family)